MSLAFNLMAWQEILAQVLDGFTNQPNVSPDWLVNPATRRRLKLDQYYPQIGLAVRFVGLTAKGQPKQSDWELLEEEQRDQTRSELCRLNGVELFLLNLDDPYPGQQLRQLRTSLGRCSRMLAQGQRPAGEKAALMPQLALARARLDRIAPRLKGPDSLALYAQLWRDREAALVAATRQTAPAKPGRSRKTPRLQLGQRVLHSHFGPGEVTALNGSSNDPEITVLFDDGSQRTFLASLAAGKLKVE